MMNMKDVSEAIGNGTVQEMKNELLLEGMSGRDANRIVGEELMKSFGEMTQAQQELAYMAMAEAAGRLPKQAEKMKAALLYAYSVSRIAGAAMLLLEYGPFMKVPMSAELKEVG